MTSMEWYIYDDALQNLSKVDMKTEPQQFIGELGAFSRQPKTKETNSKHAGVSNSLLHSFWNL